MIIFVQTIFNYKIYKIDIDLNESIFELKYKMKELAAIPFDDQQLFFNKKQINDQATLKDYNVQTNSKVILRLKPGYKVSLKKPRKEVKHVFYVTIKFKLKNRVIRILKVNIYETILNLKERLEVKSKVKAIRQILSHEGLTLQNEGTLYYYGIEVNSTLLVVVREEDIFDLTLQTPKGGRIYLEVKLKDTLYKVKQQISKKTSFSVYEQVLLYKGVELLDNEVTLYDHRIRNGDTELYLYLKQSI